MGLFVNNRGELLTHYDKVAYAYSAVIKIDFNEEYIVKGGIAEKLFLVIVK